MSNIIEVKNNSIEIVILCFVHWGWSERLRFGQIGINRDIMFDCSLATAYFYGRSHKTEHFDLILKDLFWTFILAIVFF